jgi:hypothetical protein
MILAKALLEVLEMLTKAALEILTKALLEILRTKSDPKQRSSTQDRTSPICACPQVVSVKERERERDV